MLRIFSVRNIFLCDYKNYNSLLLLDVFKFDPEYLVNEDKYKQIRDGKEYESLLFLYGSSVLGLIILFYIVLICMGINSLLVITISMSFISNLLTPYLRMQPKWMFLWCMGRSKAPFAGLVSEW